MHKEGYDGLIPIDFTKPWWYVVWQQKLSFFFVIFGEIIVNIFDTITPIIIGGLFSYQRYDYFVYFSLLWLGIIIFQDFVRRVNTKFQLRCVHSLHFNAHQWFLKVDPIYHTHRESGAVLGKIDRSARSYETLLDSVLIDLLGYLTGIITALVSLMQESLLLSFSLFVLLSSIIILNLKLAYLFIVPREQNLMKADDTVKTISQENLMQINLVRSYFASNEINEQLKENDENIVIQEKRLWYANITMWTSIKIMYLSTFFILGTYLLHAINKNQLSTISGISLLVMYISGTYGIISLERPMRVALKSLTRIKDLFSFIPKFGSQTYPVLNTDSAYKPSIAQTDTISIQAENITFSYNHVPIFDHHNLRLNIPDQQELKLYGIIGPSGTGKSTLLQVLGGQLRPKEGSVRINGIDVYAVDDAIRKLLIAMQGQVSTSLRGTLKYNLLFGLPLDITEYNDAFLIQLLKQVGLWPLFEAKKGLNTKIGEGGLTLSGGQRQRLNFASLYLRANYFNPSIILIDEPTSSLDEMSEQAITDIILQMAKKALTLVIAHRLKTIENAVGILDFSLLTQEKNLTFYSHTQLLERSAYYQQLIHGKISLDA